MKCFFARCAPGPRRERVLRAGKASTSRACSPWGIGEGHRVLELREGACSQTLQVAAAGCSAARGRALGTFDVAQAVDLQVASERPPQPTRRLERVSSRLTSAA